MCRVQENERGRQGLAWFKMIVLCRDSFHLGRRFPITKAHGQFCDTSLWSLCFACGDILGVVLVEPWGDEWQDLIRYKLNVNGVYTPANHHLLWRRHNGAYYDLFGLRSSHGFASGVLSHRSGLLCLYFLHVHFFHCRSGKVPHIWYSSQTFPWMSRAELGTTPKTYDLLLWYNKHWTLKEKWKQSCRTNGE